MVGDAEDPLEHGLYRPVRARLVPAQVVIAEADVIRVLEMLPEQCFLRQYCRFAAHQVSSHLIYHVAMGLVTAGVTASRTHTSHGFKKATFPNFYAMIVGLSGDAEKTLAMDVGLDLLTDAAPQLLGTDPTAAETLLKMLQARPSLLFYYPELAKFLSATMGSDNSRGRTLRDALTDVYDGRSGGKTYSKAEPVEVVNPRVSFIGACTPRHLEELTVDLDWEGGLISRFFIAYGDRERDLSRPIPMPELRAWLLRYLVMSATWGERAGICVGLTPEADELWQWWYRDIIKRHATQMRDERVVGIFARSRLFAAKIATILSWTSGVAWGPDTWTVSRSTLEAAIALVELHLRAASALIERIQPTHEMRTQRRVLNAIAPDEWTALGAVTKGAKVSSHEALRHLRTLKDQGESIETTQGATTFYRRIIDGKPPAYNPGVEQVGSIIPFPAPGAEVPTGGLPPPPGAAPPGWAES